MTEPADQEKPETDSPVQQINRELYKRNAELAVRNKTLALLRKLDEVSLSALGIDNMAQEIVLAIAVEFGYEIVSIALVNEANKTLEWLAFGSSDPEVAGLLSESPPRTITTPINSSFASVKILTQSNKQPVFIKGTGEVFPDTLAKRLRDAHVANQTEKIHSSILYPLFFEQKALGVLTFSAERDLHELSKYEHESIEGIVGLTSLSLYKAKLYEDLQRTTNELSEANKHLEELMDIKTEFLQIASHQLRTPLTSLRGLLQMQAEGGFNELPDGERKELQKNMFAASTNLNNIVNDLLDTMELEGGKLNFQWEQVDVSTLLQESIDTLKPSYDKKGLALKFDNSMTIPIIEADKSYLRQVFLNIINNAAEYTKEGGLTITMMPTTDNLEIIFKDTGIGIDPLELPKLFGKFVRGKKSALVYTDGSGLGLFIIKKIVEEHHGTVKLESEGVSKGSTVRVILPLKQPK